MWYGDHYNDKEIMPFVNMETVYHEFVNLSLLIIAQNVSLCRTNSLEIVYK